MPDGERWIFGYGSLVWRPAFAFEERAPGAIAGFARRLWQGSPDHRGRPRAPGRVATLVREAGVRCAGIAYRVAPERWGAVVEQLDLRESGGFERHEATVCFADAGRPEVCALVYVAGPGNPNYLGPASVEEIAEQVRRSRGRSGSNLEYVLELERALRELRAEDPHISEIARLLRG